MRSGLGCLAISSVLSFAGTLFTCLALRRPGANQLSSNEMEQDPGKEERESGGHALESRRTGALAGRHRSELDDSPC
jgi:hypothetical protein